MARERARDEESKFCLILDTHISHQATAGFQDDFEKAVSLAASLAAHFLEEGAGLEYLTPYEYVPRGTGTDHLYRILRSLAVVRCERTPSTALAEFWDRASFSAVSHGPALQQILSDKVFKIIITAKPRGSFPSVIWRSSHVVFFDEL